MTVLKWLLAIVLNLYFFYAYQTMYVILKQIVFYFPYYSFYNFAFLLTGSNFYIGFFKHQNNGYVFLYLTNTGLLDASYTIEAHGIGYYAAGTVLGGRSAHIRLPSSVKATLYSSKNMGIYLKINSTNVTVIGDCSDGDTFFALPIVKICCTEYVYYGISASSGIGDSVVLIVGTENDTVMNLTVPQSVDIKVDATVISLHHGIEYSFIVNRLQTVYIGSSHDLTGTRIVTNKPVSVFSGHECGYVPSSSHSSCQLLIEQLPPIAYWGKTYYIAPLRGRIGYTIRVLAAYNSTEVILDCNNVMDLCTINAGKSFTSTHHSYCTIHSNKEILVAQYSHGYYYDSRTGDPMMMLVPATVHYSNEINLFAPSSSDSTNYINIIVLKEYFQPNLMYRIRGRVKRSLKSQPWSPIKFNQVTVAYYTQLSVSNGTVKIVHATTNALISAVVYGLDDYRIYRVYGHSGGFISQKNIQG